MSESPPLQVLQKAIRDLHGCDSTWIKEVRVVEAWEGRTVWQGGVQVFELIGHPEAKRCYAWSEETERHTTCIVAVLHKSAVDSPIAAVRSALLTKHGSD